MGWDALRVMSPQWLKERQQRGTQDGEFVLRNLQVMAGEDTALQKLVVATWTEPFCAEHMASSCKGIFSTGGMTFTWFTK